MKGLTERGYCRWKKKKEEKKRWGRSGKKKQESWKGC